MSLTGKGVSELSDYWKSLKGRIESIKKRKAKIATAALKRKGITDALASLNALDTLSSAAAIAAVKDAFNNNADIIELVARQTDTITRTNISLASDRASATTTNSAVENIPGITLADRAEFKAAKDNEEY